MPASSALRLRRRAAPIALVLGAAFGVVEGAASLGLEFPEGGAARLEAMSGLGPLLPLLGTSFLLSQMLLLAGALGVVAAIRGRGAGWANAAGLLIFVGIFAHAVVGGIMLVSAPMLDAGADRAEMGALLDRIMQSPLILPWFAAGLLGFAAGFILLSVASGRSGLVPLWVAWTIPVAIVVEFGLSTVSGYFSLAARLALLVAMALIARAIWDAPPPATDPGHAPEFGT